MRDEFAIFAVRFTSSVTSTWQEVFETHFESVLGPIFARRFLSRLKQRGQQEIPLSHIIPQQRAEPEKFPFLIGKKFVFLTMAAGDNFSNLGPFRTPRKRAPIGPQIAGYQKAGLHAQLAI